MDNDNLVQPIEDTTQPVASNTDVVTDAGNGQVGNPDNYDVRINENGDIEISDDFFGLDSDKQDQQPIDNQLTNNSNPQSNDPNLAETGEGSPAYYSEADMASISIDKLDPNRIPPQLVPFYKSMQADYTRKTQAIAQERRELEERLNQLNSPQSPQIQNQGQDVSVPQQNTEASYYQQLQTVAIKNVEKKLGTEFNELDPLHLTALSAEVSQIQNHIAESSKRKSELDSVVQKYVSDERWSEMQTYADKVLDSMPYSESKQIRDRIESGDIVYIDSFLKTVRDCFYETDGGKKVPSVNNVKPVVAPVVQRPVVKPPVLETSGVGITATPSSNGVELGKLGNMTNEQLADLFIQRGFTES